MVETAVGEDLSSKQEISELNESSEDDEEHDEEADHIPRTLVQCSRELSHGLDTFKYYNQHCPDHTGAGIHEMKYFSIK